ncbi:MAG: dehydro-3-deoxyphosphogluconate aldolase / (4S)-4-hydroxy-2-oxoglutarate aldolase [Candidatus Tokpelaia sp. JSC161]|jgi:2-dehydro-3-deoxyphosphogluconate aldolase/(4S)-4-hydroxy-2-oxoglutarate aldolase|nr:MAG: dehydro-3-deoxyphosphogluconate aldolase / (4S)-4-hydroxy-2-oxoglutarate aldolase [Candidatus Tokpelaia sp. JSC161]
MNSNQTRLAALLQKQPVIPVLIIEELCNAVPLAQALIRGGIKIIEITLRTQAALDSIKIIADHVPEAIIGAGTIINPSQFISAEKAGAKFIVSPGFGKNLLETADNSNTPFLPGAITPTEIIKAYEKNYKFFKFFPAEEIGSIAYLKAFISPFPDIKFCPTGGINRKTAPLWLALPNVICIGGSWIAPKKLIQEKQWDKITKLAKQTLQL